MRVWLVRHGQATGGWDTELDPGLDTTGAAQAEQLAGHLGPLGPMAIVSSPMRRCRQTAAPLADRWRVDVEVNPLVTEIPSPPGVPMGERVPWLRAAMLGTWAVLGDRYLEYRDAVVERIAACAADTVMVSHFVAINAVIGACLGDDRLVIRHLANTSITVVGVTDGSTHLVEVGDEDPLTLVR